MKLFQLYSLAGLLLGTSQFAKFAIKCVNFGLKLMKIQNCDCFSCKKN